MANAQVTMTIDKAQAQTHWNAAVQAIQDLKGLGGNVQDAFATVQLTANVGGTPGTVAFSVDATVLLQRLGALQARLATAESELNQVIALLQAGLPVTVNQVS